jgi:tetratricopeptide (TPR) repeat protein
MRRTLLVAMLISLADAGGLRAQAHHHDDVGLRPPADIGRVAFSISCRPAARREFEQGLALLHSFWYEEAGKAFRRAAAADAACGMAYWGHAMSLVHQLWGAPDSAGMRVGLADVRTARAAGLPTPRERAYVAAIGAYFDHPAAPGADSIKAEVRLRAYGDSAAALARRYAADDEAQIFHALALLANADHSDTSFAAAHRADSILLPLFQRHPMHPGVAHYIIHANDAPPLAPLALEAARKYAAIAPAIPHAQHMPSHIFIRVGAWDETIASNRRATASGAVYQRQEGMQGVWSHNLHTMDFLQYAYLQEGRDREAAALVDTVVAARTSTPPAPHVLAFFQALMPARQALELGDWKAAVRIPAPTAPDSGLTWSAGLVRFARGLGAARMGDTTMARAEMAGLDSIARRLTQHGDTAFARSATMERTAVSAWVALAAGDTAGAVRHAEAAASQENSAVETPLIPARELQGELLVQLGRGSEAATAFRAALRNNPNRARSLFGLARAADVAGDAAGARDAYRKYLALMVKSDGTREELAAARKSVATR